MPPFHIPRIYLLRVLRLAKRFLGDIERRKQRHYCRQPPPFWRIYDTKARRLMFPADLLYAGDGDFILAPGASLATGADADILCRVSSEAGAAEA